MSIYKFTKILIACTVMGLATNSLATTCPDPQSTGLFSIQKQGWKFLDFPFWNRNLLFKQATWTPKSKDATLYTVLCYYKAYNDKTIIIYPNKYVKKPDWKSYIGNNRICIASHVSQCVFYYGE